jgi:hypothetical protein
LSHPKIAPKLATQEKENMVDWTEVDTRVARFSNAVASEDRFKGNFVFVGTVPGASTLPFRLVFRGKCCGISMEVRVDGDRRTPNRSHLTGHFAVHKNNPGLIGDHSVPPPRCYSYMCRTGRGCFAHTCTASKAIDPVAAPIPKKGAINAYFHKVASPSSSAPGPAPAAGSSSDRKGKRKRLCRTPSRGTFLHPPP